MEYKLGRVQQAWPLSGSPAVYPKDMSTPYPALVPPKSQAKKTSQGNQSLHLPCCQLCLSCISRAKLMAQGQPVMLPSDLEAELTTICGVDPRPPRYLAESEMPGPATYAAVCLEQEGQHTKQRDYGGQLFRSSGPLQRAQSPCGRQVPCHSKQPQTQQPTW